MGLGPNLQTDAGKSTQRGWRFWGALAAGVLAAILIFQNVQEVEVNFFFASTQTPLVFALLIVFLLGAIIGWLAPRLRRGQKPPTGD